MFQKSEYLETESLNVDYLIFGLLFSAFLDLSTTNTEKNIIKVPINTKILRLSPYRK